MEEMKTKHHDSGSAVAPQYAYITRIDGVRGGNAIVVGTRIGVHDVVGLLQNGETVDSIVTQSFPDLPVRRYTNASPITRIIAEKLIYSLPGR